MVEVSDSSTLIWQAFFYNVLWIFLYKFCLPDICFLRQISGGLNDKKMNVVIPVSRKQKAVRLDIQTDAHV